MVATCQLKPTFRMKCPSLRLSSPPPAQCTMKASKMMARMTTTTQKKNTMMPGTAYPATVLALAMTASYPPSIDLFGTLTQRQSDDLRTIEPSLPRSDSADAELTALAISEGSGGRWIESFRFHKAHGTRPWPTPD